MITPPFFIWSEIGILYGEVAVLYRSPYHVCQRAFENFSYLKEWKRHSDFTTYDECILPKITTHPEITLLCGKCPIRRMGDYGRSERPVGMMRYTEG